MKIHFWGVRGSIPSPSKSTSVFGGNTSCVEIISESGHSLVFDAGTGIREFGLDYIKRKDAPRVINLFISHVHWDHIQGLPFFMPLYLADFEIHIYGCKDIQALLLRQMSPPFFPISIDTLRAKIHYHELNGSPVEAGGCSICTFSLVHPQEVFGFKAIENGKTVIYSSDTEHEVGGDLEYLIKCVSGADVMLYDAQYTPEEYQMGRTGWGHSTYEAAIDIARRAEIKKLVLIHHEPTHDDDTVGRIEVAARGLFPDTVAAREGMTINV